MLAWEGAILAGAFLVAIAHVAASAYMMERFDERTRRTSLVRYYQQRTELAAEAVRHLQESIDYYSRHTAAVERQLECSTAGSRECRRRLAERRRQLEAEVTASLAGGGSGGGGGGPLAAALAPCRALYLRWQLDRWRRELEHWDAGAHHLEQSLAHDQRLVNTARDKLRSLVRELRKEATTYDTLYSRLQAWRNYSCRTVVFSGGGQLPTILPELGLYGSAEEPRRRHRGGQGTDSAADGDGDGNKDDVADGDGCNTDVTASGGVCEVGGGGGGGGGAGGTESSGSAVIWCWTMQIYTPRWMDDDDDAGLDLLSSTPRGAEAPGDREEDDYDDDDDEEEEEGEGGEHGAGGSGGLPGFLAELWGLGGTHRS
ncbi:hypothetical protein VOLCADRAFT_106470 [Volvox carteri f. nagariensis]|uniref:Uncharacterized protein n=1 Tax=Volvox carteri f. nagariensis TaxID=3068 RepID=D8U7L4_VOLCA|nr:uncharacterized protein VOLCADRAFT_106470 [Volvox carteri f. nagariensis]EFJ44321.1 hypothetical protein VOLCADRAFT_106470 [Volvox carteri f. nagariensis]|eukprot:XP_002954680.1 hypothetical protein VOLCADRAFT_106470 [Volvox carteri f. nagariensis]